MYNSHFKMYNHKIFKHRIFKTFFIHLIISIIFGAFVAPHAVLKKSSLLASHAISMQNRYDNPQINEVFKDNILLTLSYATGLINKKSDINWEEIDKPATYDITLQPGETFAFHDNISSYYKNKKIITTNAHFDAQDGFLSSGYLYGDGVCHLASLISWTALDAGLKVTAPTNHDFANIPQIPKKYGVSIYYSPDQDSRSQNQNLYIENTFDDPITLAFYYNRGVLTFSVTKSG